MVIVVVLPVTNCTIETYLTRVDFQGIRYDKRELNTTVTASLSYKVSPVVKLTDLSFHWLLDASVLTVARLQGDHLPDRQDVYSTEKLDDATASATITLHLRNKGTVLP